MSKRYGASRLVTTLPLGTEHFTNDHKTRGEHLPGAVPTGSVLWVAPKVPRGTHPNSSPSGSWRFSERALDSFVNHSFVKRARQTPDSMTKGNRQGQARADTGRHGERACSTYRTHFSAHGNLAQPSLFPPKPKATPTTRPSVRIRSSSTGTETPFGDRPHRTDWRNRIR